MCVLVLVLVLQVTVMLKLAGSWSKSPPPPPPLLAVVGLVSGEREGDLRHLMLGVGTGGRERGEGGGHSACASICPTEDCWRCVCVRERVCVLLVELLYDAALASSKWQQNCRVPSGKRLQVRMYIPIPTNIYNTQIHYIQMCTF